MTNFNHLHVGLSFIKVAAEVTPYDDVSHTPETRDGAPVERGISTAFDSVPELDKMTDETVGHKLAEAASFIRRQTFDEHREDPSVQSRSVTDNPSEISVDRVWREHAGFDDSTTAVDGVAEPGPQT